MIGKAIRSKGRVKSKSASVRDLTDYVHNLTGQDRREHAGDANFHSEKVLFHGSRGFICDDFKSQQSEMIALAQDCVRSKNPLKHYVTSWQEGEQPTREQIEEAVDIILDQMGLATHQCQWTLHVDTDNVHLHLVVNTVRSDTGKVVKPNGGWDVEGIHRAVALIEQRQGWRREKNGRYEVNSEGAPERPPNAVKVEKRQQRPTQHAQDMETRIGEKSAQRIAIEQAAPILKMAKSWAELHSKLAAVGMTYEREGSGAVVFVDDIPAKASTVDRAGSIAQLQKRLGPFEPHTQETPNVYFTHDIVDAGDAKRRPQDGLRKLSECRLATSPRPEGRKGVLQVDARACRRKSGELRRESAGAGSGATGEHAERVFATAGGPPATGQMGRRSGLSRQPVVAGRSGRGRGSTDSRRVRRGPEPVEPGAPGWSEFAYARREHYSTMKSDFESQRILHAAQREALASAQKSERTNLFKGSWRGRGDALNAQRSIVASEQMKARLNTNDRMKNERAGLRAQYRPFPDFESWLRARGTLESQEQARSWRYRKHSDQMAQLDRNGLFGEDIKPKPVDLRAELSQVDGPVVHYTDTQRFRDDLPWS